MFGAKNDGEEAKEGNIGPKHKDGDDALRIGVINLLGDLINGIEGVDSGSDGVQEEDSEEANGEMEGVEGEDKGDA